MGTDESMVESTFGFNSLLTVELPPVEQNTHETEDLYTTTPLKKEDLNTVTATEEK